jgi:hypothetical protein
MKVVLQEIDWPEFGGPAAYPAPDSAEEYVRRLDLLRGAMERRALTHLAVYGDREHFGNLTWLTGFDPRFEEALLLIDAHRAPLLLAGNECMGYVPVSPLVSEGAIRVERFPDFSLPDQPRPATRTLADILREEGIDAHSKVGCAGWKDYVDPLRTDLPSYLADALRFAAGWENVVNATGVFIDPSAGLRMETSPAEIALFEYTGTLAAEGMKSVLRAAREGAVDHELLAHARYNGVPLGCHMTLKCGGNRLSLASARGERVVRGARLSCGICYWGANCCRAGWAVSEPSELPAESRDYFTAFAAPYFEAMAAWFEGLRIGSTGGALHRAIHDRLPFSRFGVFLNAGHLIHREEWLASPVWEGSEVPLRSGMVMQSDVIPSSPVYYSARMEDGYLLANASLRARLDPALVSRCEARRAFMRGTLGLPVHDDVLPLSNLAGIMPVYMLRSALIPTLRYS